MALPVQAFAELHPSNMDPGSLFQFRGMWSLRVSHDNGFQGFLLFQGDHAGKVHQIHAGMANCVALVQPFSWFPVVARDSKPSADGAYTITLLLTEQGPVLNGSDARDQVYEDTHMTFGLDGRGIEVANLHRASRFEQWSAELFHHARPFVSLGTLFEVDRSRQQR